MRMLCTAAVLLSVACGQRPVPVEAPTAPTLSPTSVVTSPTAEATSATPTRLPIQAEALGPVNGEVVFVLNAVPPEPNIGVEDHEVWAISADGRTSRRILRYKPVWGGPVNRLGSVTNNLARQLSPDGRTLLIAASASASGGTYRIFSVDLFAGAVRQLTNDDQFIDLEPMWSPDGTRIAFARYLAERSERELWLMRPDGSSAYRLIGGVGSLFTFTASGQDVCFATAASTYACADVTSAQTRDLGGTVTIRRPIGSAIPNAWRVGTPAFVGAFSPSPRIEVADAPGVRQRTLTTSLFGDVRWRPKTDEILVVTVLGDDWGELWRLGLDGTRQRVPTNLIVRRGEWSVDGRAIFVIAVDARTTPAPPALPPATSVHRLTADGGATDLFRAPRQMSFGLFDITSMLYR